jgi:hypothetical protein
MVDRLEETPATCRYGEDHACYETYHAAHGLGAAVACPPIVIPRLATSTFASRHAYSARLDPNGILLRYARTSASAGGTGTGAAAEAEEERAPFDWGVILDPAAIAGDGHNATVKLVFRDVRTSTELHEVPHDVVYKCAVYTYEDDTWHTLVPIGDFDGGNAAVSLDAIRATMAHHRGTSARDLPPVVFGFRHIVDRYEAHAAAAAGHELLLHACQSLADTGDGVHGWLRSAERGGAGGGSSATTTTYHRIDELDQPLMHIPNARGTTCYVQLLIMGSVLARDPPHLCAALACVDEEGDERRATVHMIACEPSGEPPCEETESPGDNNDNGRRAPRRSTFVWSATQAVAPPLRLKPSDERTLAAIRVYLRWGQRRGGERDPPSFEAIHVTNARYKVLPWSTAAAADDNDEAHGRGRPLGGGGGVASASDFQRLHLLEANLKACEERCSSIEIKKGPRGLRGERGPKGARGDPFRFEDLTPEQRRELRGARGLTGARGAALTFAQLTEPERASLVGPAGPPGKRGARGETGQVGPRGPPMRFDDLDAAQRAALRGPRGEAGPRGAALTFDQLRPAEKHELRGEPGPRGERGARGQPGPTGMVGPVGPAGERGERGVRGMTGLPGCRGVPGERGADGVDGVDGASFTIASQFRTVDEMLQYARSVETIPRNAHFILDSPDDPSAHGLLHRYSGVLRVDLVVECVYAENLRTALQAAGSTVLSLVEDRGEEEELGEGSGGDGGGGGGGGSTWRVRVECTERTAVAVLPAAASPSRPSSSDDGGHGEEQAATTMTTMTTTTTTTTTTGGGGDDDGHAPTTTVYKRFLLLCDFLRQANYEIRRTTIVDEAIVPTSVQLRGVAGSPGPRGPAGARGDSIAGLRVHAVGGEIERLQLRVDDDASKENVVFLQVGASKTSDSGFYLWLGESRRWLFLHGIDVDSEFHEWMDRFQRSPEDGAIPLALSLFASTRTQLEGAIAAVRQALHDQEKGHERWKRLQFEQWKTVGATQFQQCTTDIAEVRNTCEGITRQLDSKLDSVVRADELNTHRKRVGQQLGELDKRLGDLQRATKAHVENEYTPSRRFDAFSKATQASLARASAEIVDLMKAVEVLHAEPWANAVAESAIELREQLELLEVRLAAQAQEAQADRERAAGRAKQLDKLEQAAGDHEKQRRAWELSASEDLKELQADSVSTRRALTKLVEQDLREKHERLDEADKDAAQRLATVAHELKDLRGAYKQVEGRLTEHVSSDFAAAVRSLTEDGAQLRKRLDGNELATAQRLSAMLEDLSGKLLDGASEQSSKLQRTQGELLAKIEQVKHDAQQSHTKSLYVVKNGVGESLALVRKQIDEHGQALGEARGALEQSLGAQREELLQAVGARAEATAARAAQQHRELKAEVDEHEVQLEAARRDLAKLRAAAGAADKAADRARAEAETREQRHREKLLEKALALGDAKLLKTVETLQKRLEEYDARQSERGRQLTDALAEARAGQALGEKRAGERLAQAREELAAQAQGALRALEDKHARELAALGAAHKTLAKAHADERRQQQLAQRQFTAAAQESAGAFEKRAEAQGQALRATVERLHAEHQRHVEQRAQAVAQALEAKLAAAAGKGDALETTVAGRFDAVEAHVQQLFEEGQAKTAKLLAESGDGTQAALAATRDAMLAQLGAQAQQLREHTQRQVAEAEALTAALRARVEASEAALREARAQAEARRREDDARREALAKELRALREEARAARAAHEAQLAAQRARADAAIERAGAEAQRAVAAVREEALRELRALRERAETDGKARVAAAERRTAERLAPLDQALRAIDGKFEALVVANDEGGGGGATAAARAVQGQLDRVEGLLAAMEQKRDELLCA